LTGAGEVQDLVTEQAPLDLPKQEPGVLHAYSQVMATCATGKGKGSVVHQGEANVHESASAQGGAVGALGQSISDAETMTPLVASAIKECTATKKQLVVAPEKQDPAVGTLGKAISDAETLFPQEASAFEAGESTAAEIVQAPLGSVREAKATCGKGKGNGILGKSLDTAKAIPQVAFACASALAFKDEVSASEKQGPYSWDSLQVHLRR